MLGIIMSRLDKIETTIKSRSTAPVGEYLTPKECCEVLKISKNKFYSWVEQGYLNPIKPDPNGRKTYIMRSEIAKMFPSDFPPLQA